MFEYKKVDRDSWVGIATQYRLDRLGIEPCMVARFFAPVKTGPWGPYNSCTMGTGSFPGVKRPERGVDHPPHLTPRFKMRRAIPLLPSVLSCDFVRWTLKCIEKLQHNNIQILITFHWIRRNKYKCFIVLVYSTLTFRHRASCILGQAFRYSPENAFYIFNQ